jgi:hypothetical protein
LERLGDRGVLGRGGGAEPVERLGEFLLLCDEGSRRRSLASGLGGAAQESLAVLESGNRLQEFAAGSHGARGVDFARIWQRLDCPSGDESTEGSADLILVVDGQDAIVARQSIGGEADGSLQVGTQFP